MSWRVLEPMPKGDKRPFMVSISTIGEERKRKRTRHLGSANALYVLWWPASCQEDRVTLARKTPSAVPLPDVNNLSCDRGFWNLIPKWAGILDTPPDFKMTNCVFPVLSAQWIHIFCPSCKPLYVFWLLLGFLNLKVASKFKKWGTCGRPPEPWPNCHNSLRDRLVAVNPAGNERKAESNIFSTYSHRSMSTETWMIQDT